MKIFEFDKYVSNYVKSIIGDTKYTVYNKFQGLGSIDTQINTFYDLEFINSQKGKIDLLDYTPSNTKVFLIGINTVKLEDIDSKLTIIKNFAGYFPLKESLSLSYFDLKLISFFIAKKTKLPSLSERFENLENIICVDNITTPIKVNTLCITPSSSNSEKYIVYYNLKFVERCIFEDYIKFYSGVPNFRNYKGALQTIAYLIGHELLHDQLAHFSERMRKYLYQSSFKNYNINSLQTPLQPEAKNILKRQQVYKQEVMCNTIMTKALDIGAVDTGVEGNNSYNILGNHFFIYSYPSEKEGKRVYKIRDDQWFNSISYTYEGIIPSVGDLVTALQLFLLSSMTPSELKKIGYDPDQPRQKHIHLKVGDKVRDKKTGKLCIVTKASKPDKDDLQDIEIRPLINPDKSELETEVSTESIKKKGWK